MAEILDRQSEKSLPSIEWERVRCNLCGADDCETYHRERGAFFGRQLDFEIVRCRRCGLVYTNPRLAAVNATYTEGGEEDAFAIEAHARAKLSVFCAALAEIEKYRTAGGNGRLLDIGCGSGHFLQEALKAEYEVLGIEPAHSSAVYGRKRFSLEIIEQEIADVELPAESFEIITAWDVIEHVADPCAVMEKCVNWLSPGGVMALRFPSSTWQKIKGTVFHNFLNSDRASFGPTMHLTFFNGETFTALARSCGLDVMQIRTTGAEANTNRPLLDAAKLAAERAVRVIELLSGKSLGNLEVYCRKGINSSNTPCQENTQNEPPGPHDP